MAQVDFKRVPIASLHEDPANARRHPDRNRAVVRASLAEFGQVEALVVERGTGRVIGGNCRLGELRAMGVMEVMVAEVDLHGIDATRLALALNRSAEIAEWDAHGLAKLLEEIGTEAAEAIGFDEDIDDLLRDLEDAEGWGGIGTADGRENAIKDPVVSVMIHCRKAATVEAAVEAALTAGAASRGDALEAICRSYLDA